MLPTFSDIDIMARTIWGEARGEPHEGMQAVACVILSRVFDAKGRWPDTPAEVCLQPYQFSAWNKSDVNRPKLAGVGLQDAKFRECYAIAAAAVAGLIDDRTGGANHYCVTSIIPRVGWARGVEPVAAIGVHSFYKL